MFNSNYFKITLLLLSITIFSCEGPAGPTGEQGVPGPMGEQGIPGNSGEDGALDLVDSGWKEAPTLPTTQQGFIFTDFDFLNEDLINSYVFLVYGKDRSNFIYPVPKSTATHTIHYAINTENPLLTMIFEVLIENFTVQFDPLMDFYRIIAIQVEDSNSNSGKNNVTSINNILKSNGVDLENYEEVMDFYGLEY